VREGEQGPSQSTHMPGLHHNRSEPGGMPRILIPEANHHLI
jgi:hypothetical protein